MSKHRRGGKCLGCCCWWHLFPSPERLAFMWPHIPAHTHTPTHRWSGIWFCFLRLVLRKNTLQSVDLVQVDQMSKKLNFNKLQLFFSAFFLLVANGCGLWADSGEKRAVHKKDFIPGLGHVIISWMGDCVYVCVCVFWEWCRRVDGFVMTSPKASRKSAVSTAFGGKLNLNNALFSFIHSSKPEFF